MKSLKVVRNNKVVRLTPRKKEIIILLASGRTYQEIADKLKITTKTLENYLVDIRRKLKVFNNISLVIIVLQQGLVKIDEITVATKVK